MKKLITFAGLLLVCSAVQAGRIDCGYIDLKTLYVQSDRSDGGGHNNKLLVQLGGSCPSYGYVSNDEPAYDSILSMLLSAKMAKQKIRVVVNDGPLISDAAKIEWVNFN
jgi:hypothetical protein